jgi:hypothetical protein
MVARLAWDEEVIGSKPITLTNKGEMPEWLNGAHSKRDGPLRDARVRIPVSPPDNSPSFNG